MTKRDVVKQVCEKVLEIPGLHFLPEQERLIRAFLNKLNLLKFCIYCGRQEEEFFSCEACYFVPINKIKGYGFTVLCLECEKPLKEHTCGSEEHLVGDREPFQPWNIVDALII